jgi:hypothetical protein
VWAIQQSFATDVGLEYLVTFSMASNHDSFELGYLKILVVWFNYPSEEKRYTFSTEGKTGPDMGWE